MFTLKLMIGLNKEVGFRLLCGLKMKSRDNQNRIQQKHTIYCFFPVGSKSSPSAI